MPIVIHPSSSIAATQAGAATPVVLQPGSVISARVLQVLGDNSVRIAIGGQQIDVQSQVPLQAGQTLQLSVSQASDGSVRLALVDAQAAANTAAATDSVTLAPEATASIAAQIPTAVVVAASQLTPAELSAVSLAAQTAAIQQTSLAPLFANLSVAAGLDNLPPPLQLAVAQVLSQRTSLDPSLTGNDIRQAFQNSGLFLEASLAATSVSSAPAAPDLKAALIVLRQVLTTSLNAATVTQTATLTLGVPVTLAVPATLDATPAAGVLLSQAATPSIVLQQGATPSVAVAPSSVPLPVSGVPQGAAPGDVVPAQGTATLIPLSLQAAIPVVLETPMTASPALAPLLGSEVATSRVLPPGAVAPAPQAVLNPGTVNPVISPPATPAEAAARAVASSAALNLLQETLQPGSPTSVNPSAPGVENNEMLSLLPALNGARSLRVDDAEFARANVPPPIAGALPAAQPVAAATLVQNSPLETAMHHLLADTDGAIARQTLLQVASLPAQADPTAARIDPATPRWSFEIPFIMPQGTAMAQFEISRDGGGDAAVEAAKRVWRARFSLDVEPAGPVHALVSLSGDKTSVRMWAERPATAAQLRAGAAQLSQALSRAALSPGDIVIRDGAPPQPAPARAGHFLDRAL